MLKKLRVIGAALCFLGVCLLFLDASGTLPQHLAFLAKMQFVPAILAGGLVVVLVHVALTLVAGRVYCSVVCPLGVFQDIVGHFGKKRRFRRTTGKTIFRVAALFVFMAALVFGLPVLFGAMEPYSAFGRMATGLFSPVWNVGNNGLAKLSENTENYWFSASPIGVRGGFALGMAVSTFLVVGIFAYRSGRTWCNTICPVGTVLGGISRFSIFRTRINKDKCSGCGLCEKSCKASCIDAKAKDIDSTRCVSCFNCMEVCPRDSIAFALPPATRTPDLENGEADASRRNFLLSAALLALPASAMASGAKEAQVPALTRKTRYKRDIPVLPPGAKGLREFTSRCTGCQLCVSNCPNLVLGSFGDGVGGLQPSLSFERGYCRVNCVACSIVCPTGAIRPITTSDKSAIQIGRAVIDRERCIRRRENVECTTCTRNCPAGAISAVQRKDGKKDIAVDAERCVGCGACEYYCPVRPTAAITVSGNMKQHLI